MEKKASRPSAAKMEAFLDEYRALCRRHGLMVFSDGEAVQIGDADEELWGLAPLDRDLKRPWLKVRLEDDEEGRGGDDAEEPE